MRQIVFAALSALLVASPAFAQAPWIHDNWEFRVPFDAVPAQIEGTETFVDFGMLVTLDGTRHAQVFADAKPDGSDLMFTTRTGATVLSREIVTYDPVGETAEIWVRVTGLSKIANEFFLYFDNPAATLDPDPADAWGDDYRVVYHFDEDPTGLILADSSPVGANVYLNGGHGWTSGDVEPGAVGQGWHLNGSTHFLATNDISTTTTNYTFEAWLTHDYQSSDFFTQANPDYWHISSQVANTQNPDYGDSGLNIRWQPSPLPYLAPYHHFLWQFDDVDDTIRFYYDGIPQPVTTMFPPETSPLYSGRLVNPTLADPVGVVGPMFYFPGDFHAGGADEFRIREGRPSADRILTEFRCADDNAGFLQFDPVETRGATGIGGDLANASTLWLRSYPNPSPGRSSISYSLPQSARVRLGVFDLAGRRVASLVNEVRPAGTWTANWDGRDAMGQPVATGVYFLRLETPLEIQSLKLTLVR